MSRLHQAHLQRMYGPIGAGFAVVTLALLGGVLYLGATRTTITVTPKLKTVTDTLQLTIGPADNSSPDRLTGTISSSTMTEQAIATPNGQGAETPAHAHGTITIKNTSTQSQPLAARTRLQAENGQIVRTTARVDVPASGSVDATVTADALGLEGNIAPGKFVIVALWPGLQDKIYGQSTTTLTGGTIRAGSTLSLDALTDASDEAQAKIRTSFGQNEPGTMKILVPVSVATSPKPEVPSDQYAVTVVMKAITVTYPNEVLQSLISARLKERLAVDEVLRSVTAAEIKAGEQPTADTLVVTVTAKGDAAVSSTAPLLQPAQFVSRDRSAIVTQLLGSDAVKSAAVVFSPAWRRSAPNQPDRITVVVNDPLP